MKCPKHPKFKGSKEPKNQCPVCTEMFLLLSRAPRTGVKPTKVFKDKSKYNRKEKHRRSPQGDQIVSPGFNWDRKGETFFLDTSDVLRVVK